MDRLNRAVRLLYRHGILTQLGKIALLLCTAVAVLTLSTWIGNPYQDAVEPPEAAASSWHPPPRPTGPPEPSLPSGFPSMEFPPPLVKVGNGQLQPVPTRYGLTYTVPSDGWSPSNDAIMAWNDEIDHTTIASYEAVSRYGIGYCRQTEGSVLASVGVDGRNGIDIDTAARDEVDKASRIFGDRKTNHMPAVQLRGPITFEISGRPASRYTAVVTDIPKKSSCDPVTAEFDIVATAAYASAEVAIFMIQHYTNSAESLSRDEVEKIIQSIGKTNTK
ncbi:MULTISPECIES: hypothetical protein [Nocardia]|uniref:DUF8017 domain-containing protein n=1 Tax=Nocardia implantans TaxID=3108168 RepID=A0ABU6AP92_9NOCA|nr:MULTISPECIES: hypothetical protein [unclassified Nocardia]MBF6192193.1 hypothetical protein [Nocardia beijingensis]MEA3530944.1 hypothetical protein [Nocardia sp. CDC192]MEB3509034.1 hypothetical protein [Nocardia sp. CDC186]